MPFALPIITILFFAILFLASPNTMDSLFSETKNSFNSLTGQAIGDNKYLIQGFIEVSVDENLDKENCVAQVSVYSGDEKKYENSMSLEDFLSKSGRNQDKYSFSLENLGIMLSRGQYDLNFEAFCDGRSISKSSHKILI
jgi:hypothetical protein